MKRLLSLALSFAILVFATYADEVAEESDVKNAAYLEQLFSAYQDEIIKENGRISRIVSPDKSYDDFIYSPQGRLERIDSYYSTGTLKQKSVFYRDPATGEVILIDKQGLGDVFFLSLDERQNTYIKSTPTHNAQYTTLDSSVIYTADEATSYKYSDDTLIIKRPSGELIYDLSGRLIKNGAFEYKYTSEGEIDTIEQKSTDGKLLTLEKYENSKPSYKETYDKNGKLSKKLVFDPSGNSELYYENSIPYARAFYDQSGKRVIKVEYL